MPIISTLNNIPKFRVYTPFSFNFMPRLILKLLLYIGIIITFFAIAFSFLLGNKEAFTSPLTAIGKTFSWMMGDLAYDDGFVVQSTALLYPYQTTILFNGLHDHVNSVCPQHDHRGFVSTDETLRTDSQVPPCQLTLDLATQNRQNQIRSLLERSQTKDFG